MHIYAMTSNHRSLPASLHEDKCEFVPNTFLRLHRVHVCKKEEFVKNALFLWQDLVKKGCEVALTEQR